ncbi:MAG TPA: FAD-dependent monooxygenase [Burkholderiaceae bacterium]|jgi:2-octaprenyl-6-methoxyphenol hydroxylase|nr:FAD-dependent monooxygenase [Burkholderiaceae bacterium]
MMTDTDIVVCGAGPVGLAFSLLLVKGGVTANRITVIDAKSIEQAAEDPRSIALSYGSRQILEEIGAWPIAADAIHQIHVSRRGHFGKTLIDRTDFEVPALGYVTRYGALAKALGACAIQANITMLRPKHVLAINESPDSVSVALSDSGAVTAALAVQAEGGVFAEQASKAMRRDYDQVAIVAQCWTSAAIAHRAFERFTDEGPLALLPQDDGYALVWCVRPAHAEKLLNLPDAAFLHELSLAFGSRVGRFVRMTPRFSFPLGLNAQAGGSARTVAIGNAAQTLHPVAGQGLNLGLRDAVILAQALAKEASPAALQSFEAKRQTDRRVTINLTDVMARIFASAPDGALSQTVLGATLGLVDAIKPAKRALAEQMMFGWR